MRITITSAAQLRQACDPTVTYILPDRLNPALKLTDRLPAFESATGIQAVASWIHRGQAEWSDIADAVAARRKDALAGCASSSEVYTRLAFFAMRQDIAEYLNDNRAEWEAESSKSI